MSSHFLTISLSEKTYKATIGVKTVIIVQYLIYLAISIAFLISALYYKENIESSIICFVQNNSNVTVNASELYNQSLLMVIIYHSIDSLRSVLVILFIISSKSILSPIFDRLYQFLAINGFFGFFVLASLHYCVNIPCNNLPMRSALLKDYLIFYWSLLGL